MTTFTFPAGTVTFELIIASTMDVYLVTVEINGEKKYFEDAYKKSQITEELARQLLEESEDWKDEPKNKITIVDSKGTRTVENPQIDLGKSFEKHKEVNQLLRDWDVEPLGDRIEDYEGSEPTYHKWDMER